jgi:hypothetical protein
VSASSHAARIAKEGITVQIGRGRPKKLKEVGGTSPRSVRFPDEVWKRIEARAKKKGSRFTRRFERPFSRGSRMPHEWTDAVLSAVSRDSNGDAQRHDGAGSMENGGVVPLARDCDQRG